MKAIQIGNRFEIYDNNLQTHDQLPAQIYSVRFDKMTGFYLEVRYYSQPIFTSLKSSHYLS